MIGKENMTMKHSSIPALPILLNINAGYIDTAG
jgi:hypothetical protein